VNERKVAVRYGSVEVRMVDRKEVSGGVRGGADRAPTPTPRRVQQELKQFMAVNPTVHPFGDLYLST